MSAPDGLIEADPKVGRLRGKRCERVRRASCEVNRRGAVAINPISARIAAASNTNLFDNGRPIPARIAHYVAARLSMATGPSRLCRQRRRQAWSQALMATIDHLRRPSYIVMMKRLRLPGGDLEYAVLAKLWEIGTASARDIHGYVGEPAGLVYTTTAKVLDRLHDKGLVTRERRGKAFSYRARIARDVIDRARAATSLSRLFGSRPHAAVATLVEAVESLDPKLLDELEKAVAARQRSRHGT